MPVGVPVALGVTVALAVMEGEAPGERLLLGVPVDVAFDVGVTLLEGGVGEPVGDEEGVAPAESVPVLLGVSVAVGVAVPVLEMDCVAVLLGVPEANSPVPVIVPVPVGVKEAER